MAASRKKRRNYLIAAAMTAGIILFGVFLYRVSKYGPRFVLNGYPDSRAMPELGRILQEKDYESCCFAYIRYETDRNSHHSVLNIDFEHDSYGRAELLIRDALEIRTLTEQYMAQHPEQFDGQRVILEFHDAYDASPTFVRFLNYDLDRRGEPEAGGLMYGVFDAGGATLEMLKDARGFKALRLLDFAYPEDFSALDGMDSLQKLEFNDDINSGTHCYSQEILDAFAKQHPDCKLTGNFEITEEAKEDENT